MDEMIEELTRTQKKVLGYLQDSRGLTYKEIGELMGISWQTVRFHVHMVYEKLGIGGDGARARVMRGVRVRARDRRMMWVKVRRRLMERINDEGDVIGDGDVIDWYVVSGGT